MKLRSSSSWVLLVLLTMADATTGVKDTESPQYTVVHSDSKFEIRLYQESTWMTAPTSDISFKKATFNGFHRLYEYIRGANLNWSRISMTVPVLTSVVPGAGPSYIVQLYLPLKFQATPPVPLPELNLIPDTHNSHCIAVRTFSGFARDDNIVKEAEKLASSLNKSQWANLTDFESKYAYSIAQYNSPFRFVRRVNEVWIDVTGSLTNGCKSSFIASY